MQEILQEIAYSLQEDLCLKHGLVGSEALFDMEHFVQGNLTKKPQITHKYRPSKGALRGLFSLL